jgi:haloalkane dehalogenase
MLDLKTFRALYPFRSRYLLRHGYRMHYIDEGAGDPVVMIHGNPTWSFYYRALVNALSPAYRVIAPDHLGCGLSDTPPEKEYRYILDNRIDDIEYLIDNINTKDKLTLVLHDWGGMIGMAYAVRHPERIGRIVVTNTAAFPAPGGKRLPWRLRLIRDVPALAAPAVRGLNLFCLGALFMAARRPLAPAVKAGLLAPYNSYANRLAVLRFVQDIPLGPGDPSYGAVRDTAERLKVLAEVPMLICWGMRDFVFDADYLAEWRRRFPQAEVKSFPDAGHYLFEDAPREAVERVRLFLEAHPLQQGNDHDPS